MNSLSSTSVTETGFALLEQYCALRTKTLQDAVAEHQHLLNGFTWSVHQQKDRLLQLDTCLLEDYTALVERHQEHNRQYSGQYNLLKLVKLTETTHSYLLAHLLDPRGSHGQGNHFLVHLLEQLRIEVPRKGVWVVTAEKGRVDILIRRHAPHSVVVIENKSNDAGDQLHQLYRYWYQQIYYPNRHHPVTYAQEHPEQYRIMYLAPSSEKIPLDHSLTRPLHWPKDLPEKLPMKPLHWQFRLHIVPWLERALKDIPNPQNHRLRENVKQYIDLWK